MCYIVQRFQVEGDTILEFFFFLNNHFHKDVFRRFHFLILYFLNQLLLGVHPPLHYRSSSGQGHNGFHIAYTNGTSLTSLYLG